MCAPSPLGLRRVGELSVLARTASCRALVSCHGLGRHRQCWGRLLVYRRRRLRSYGSRVSGRLRTRRRRQLARKKIPEFADQELGICRRGVGRRQSNQGRLHKLREAHVGNNEERRGENESWKVFVKARMAYNRIEHGRKYRNSSAVIRHGQMRGARYVLNAKVQAFSAGLSNQNRWTRR